MSWAKSAGQKPTDELVRCLLAGLVPDGSEEWLSSLSCHVLSCHVLSCHVLSCHVLWRLHGLRVSASDAQPAFTDEPTNRAIAIGWQSCHRNSARPGILRRACAAGAPGGRNQASQLPAPLR